MLHIPTLSSRSSDRTPTVHECALTSERLRERNESEGTLVRELECQRREEKMGEATTKETIPVFLFPCFFTSWFIAQRFTNFKKLPKRDPLEISESLRRARHKRCFFFPFYTTSASRKLSKSALGSFDRERQRQSSNVGATDVHSASCGWPPGASVSAASARFEPTDWCSRVPRVRQRN